MAFLEQAANRGSISSGYDVSNSVKLERDNSERFKLDYPSTGSRTTQTISMWIKRIDGGVQQVLWATSGADSHEGRMFLRFQANDKLRLSTGTTVLRETNRLFRDTAAWYHIVVRLDTTQSTAANRHRIYINGVEETDFGTTSNMNQNQNMGTNYGSFSVGDDHVDTWSGTKYYRGYVAQVASVESSEAPTKFGEFDSDTQIWKPKNLSGLTYGSRGFWLEFDDSSAMGDDHSGNGNDFTGTNIGSTDQALDSPTNNFCIMNNNSRTNGNIHFEHGGVKGSTDGGSGWVSMAATMGVAAGKWYWEGFFENNSDARTVFWGICAANDPWIPARSGGYYLGNVSTMGSLGWYGVNGVVYNGSGTWNGMNYGNHLQFALDMDNMKIYFGANGTWGNSSNPATGSNGVDVSARFAGLSNIDQFILPALSIYQGCRARINFGGYYNDAGGYSISSSASDANGYGNFEYAPPSGYYALCSKNLAEFG